MTGPARTRTKPIYQGPGQGLQRLCSSRMAL